MNEPIPWKRVLHCVAPVLIGVCLFSACKKKIQQPNPKAPAGPEADIREVIGAYQSAIRKGDGKAYWAVFSGRAQETGGATDDFKFPPRPDFQIPIDRVVVRTRTAAVFSTVDAGGEPQYDGYRMVHEAGRWRIDRIEGNNRPLDARMFLPPESGRFLAAGSPWNKVPRLEPPANGPDHAHAPAWQLVIDESYVYLRASFAEPLTATGTELKDAMVSAADLGLDLPFVELVVGPADKPTDTFIINISPTVETRFNEGKNTYRLDYSVSISSQKSDFTHSAFAGSASDLFILDGTAFEVRLPVEVIPASDGSALSLSTPGYQPQRHTATAF